MAKIMPEEIAKKVNEKHGFIVNMDHFKEVCLFAASIDKSERLERALLQASFPTYFGAPARTTISPDFAPHSFYFEIYTGGLDDKKFAMNGGVIWHEASQDWGVHT